MEKDNSIPVTQEEDDNNELQVNNTASITTTKELGAKKACNKKRKRTNKHKKQKTTNSEGNEITQNDVLLDILDDVNAKSKVAEQRNSARSHFNYFLKLRNEQLLAEGKPVEKSQFDELTFEDFDQGPYIGEFSNYLGQIARLYKNPANELISYGSATGYMGSIKNAILDKFHKQGVPSQLRTEVWKRKLIRVQSMKISQAK